MALTSHSRSRWNEILTRQDAFRGLKFTFLDQEAKRQFLFSITGDAPQVVEEGENDALGT